jgi:hypothetical protein
MAQSAAARHRMHASTADCLEHEIGAEAEREAEQQHPGD